jgi:uncharacterized protein YkwD
MSRRVVGLAVLLLATALAAGTVAAAAPARRAAVTATPLEQQLLRELNAVRRSRGLRTLRPASALRTAAVAHTHAMLAGPFFAHESRDGTSMAERVRRFYPPRGGTWAVGENLIWASPRLGARQAITAWLGSPGHRRNMLAAQWREVGIGAVRAASPGGPFGRGSTVVVVTMDFGVRG